MTETLESPRNIMLKNVTIQYPKLKNHVNYMGTDQWECGIITEDPDQAKEWMDKSIGKVKPNDPMKPTAWTCSLSRKIMTKAGKENGPVRVVNSDKTKVPDSELTKIGNGTVCNIILFQGPYDNEFGTGITSSLTALQILELVSYDGGFDEMDFDLEGEGADIEGAEEGEIF
jgi:hypothetical protein